MIAAIYLLMLLPLLGACCLAPYFADHPANNFPRHTQPKIEQKDRNNKT